MATARKGLACAARKACASASGETRALISGTAMPLFMERGFDQVSITEIAAAAGVAEKTVYNYFPAKAEMFFDEAVDVLGELLAAVRYRAAGQSAVDAVGTFIGGGANGPRAGVRSSPVAGSARSSPRAPPCRHSSG